MVKINSSKESDLRKRVYWFAENHKDWLKKDIGKHFKKEFVSRSSNEKLVRHHLTAK